MKEWILILGIYLVAAGTLWMGYEQMMGNSVGQNLFSGVQTGQMPPGFDQVPAIPQPPVRNF